MSVDVNEVVAPPGIAMSLQESKALRSGTEIGIRSTVSKEEEDVDYLRLQFTLHIQDIEKLSQIPFQICYANGDNWLPDTICIH